MEPLTRLRRGLVALVDPASGATIEERSRVRGLLSFGAAALVLVVGLATHGVTAHALPEVAWGLAAGALTVTTRIPRMRPLWDRIGGVTAIAMISLLLVLTAGEDHNYIALFYLNGVFGAAYYASTRLRLETALTVVAMILLPLSGSAYALGSSIVAALVYTGVVTSVAWLVDRTRLSEEQQRQAQGRYEAAFEASPLPIVTLDMAGAVTAVNPAFVAWSGYPPDAVVGFDFRQFLAPEDVRRADEAFAEVTDGNVIHRERTVIDARGHRRYVSTTSIPLTDGRTQLGVWTLLRDITNERTSAEALRASEERHRLLVQRIPAVVYLVPPEAREGEAPFWFISPQVEEWLGYPVRSWLGEPGFAQAVIHPEDLEDVLAASRRAHAEGRDRRLEYRVLTAAGQVRWVLDEAHPVPGPDDQPGWTQGVLLDITAEKTAQQELGLRAARLRRLAGFADVAMGSEDATQVLRAALEAAAEVSGASVAVFYRASGDHLVLELRHGPADADVPVGFEDTALLDRILADGSRELPAQSLTGSDDGHSYAVPVTAGNGPLGLLVIHDPQPASGGGEFEDQLQLLAGLLSSALRRLSTVDALRRSETTAREQAERATTLVGASPLPILEVAGDGRLLSLNDEAALLFGVDVAAVGRPLADALPDVAPRLEPFLAVARTGRRPPPALVTTELPNGRRVVLQVHASQRLGSDAAGDVVLFVVDETDRLALEAHVTQATKMEALGRLAGGIAHDLNNLLTIIRSYADLASTTDEDEQRMRDLHALMEVVDEGAEMVASLLGQPRAVGGAARSLPLAKALLDDRAFYERVLPPGVELRLDVAPDVPEVRIAASHLRGALLNLLSNAAESLDGGGHVTLRARREDEVAVVSVVDEGHGMDAATSSRILEPFFTTKHDRGGTGLGLYSVYRFVTDYGGRLDIDSTPGQGTTMSIVLPAAEHVEAAGDRSEAPDPTTRRAGAGAVLLVEDDAQLRQLCERILRSADHDVVAVRSAEDGLEHLRSRRFDVLLSDVVLPGMSGTTLAEAARRLRPDLAVVLMSGHVGDAAAREGVRLGDLDLIPKPFTRKQLLGRVADAMSGARTDGGH